MFRGLNGLGGASDRGQPMLDGGFSLVSPAAIGAINRGRILQALYDNGPTSRVDLSRLAGVNRTTVTGIVQPLIEGGLLIEGKAGRSSAQGGKPARPVYFNPAAPTLCAVLLLPGTIQTCLVSLTGELTAHRQATFNPREDREAFAATLFATLGETLAQAKRPPFGVGIAAGGMIDRDKGEIVAVNLAPILSGMPIAALLSERFAMPVVIDHHPRALLVGDRWFGQGRGLQNFAVIYTGDVLGGAFFIDGRVYRGLAGSGGELGHTVVQFDGRPCNCGRRGCWETIATLTWLREEAKAAGLDDAETIDSARLARAAAAGSEAAERLLDRYARHIAVGIANLQQTMSLNFYILHGDAAGGGEALAQRIKLHIDDLVMKRPNQEVVILVNDNATGDMALRGAAGLILSHYLQLVI
jgi:predicted NBD/HSP70 family sugar kinase